LAAPCLALFAIYLVCAVLLPAGLVVVTSFFSVFGVYTPQTMTLANYAAIFTDAQIGRALSNTLFLAVGGGFIAMLLCSLIAYVQVRTDFPARRLLELIAWLPWALPGTVLSLAMLWAYIRLPVPIYGTIWVLLLAYVTFGLPLGVRSMSGVLTQISRDLEESARTSGASWRQTFLYVVLALVRPGFIAGWLLLGVLFMRSLSSPRAGAAMILPISGLSVFGTQRPRDHILRGMSQSISQLSLLLAFSLMPLAGAVAINFSSPLFAALVSILWLKERAGPARWAALLIGFVGVLIVTDPGANSLTLGALFALINAIMYGSVTVAVRGMTRTESANTLVIWQLTVLTFFHSFLLIFGWRWPSAARLNGWCS